MITISARLKILCALANPEIPLYDVGCDHGYLGLWAHAFLQTPTTLIDCRPHILENFRARWGKHYPKIETECAPAEKRAWDKSPRNIVIAGMGPESIFHIARAIGRNEVHTRTRLILCPEKKPFELLMRLEELGWESEPIKLNQLNPQVMKTCEEIKSQLLPTMGGLAHIESNKRTRFFFRLRGRPTTPSERQARDKSPSHEQ